MRGPATGLINARSQRLLPLALLTAATLSAAGIALGSSPGKERISLTAAGNAQAQAELLRRADLGTSWRGGIRKPDLSSVRCSGYKPNQSDLVLVGAARADWHNTAFSAQRPSRATRFSWAPAGTRSPWHLARSKLEQLPRRRSAPRAVKLARILAGRMHR